jgi:hypothetical protein
MAVGQVLGESRVLDTQRGIAFPAGRRLAAFLAQRGGLSVSHALLFFTLCLCFCQGGTLARALTPQRASPFRLPMFRGKEGLLFQSECDHVVMSAPTQGFRNGTPLRLCYLLLQY